LRLHEIQQAREDEHKELLNKNISLLKQIEAAYEKDRLASMRLETQLNDALNAINTHMRTLDKRKADITKDRSNGEDIIKSDALEKFQTWLTSINDEIKKTRIIAENAWKDKIEAERKTNEIQKLWERQKDSVTPL